MRFADRLDAARQLAGALGRFRGASPLVLAIPRGAAPMGRVIATALQGDFDVVLVRKLGAPGNPELAAGAVDESGWSTRTDFAASVGATPSYLAEETARQLAVLRRRRSLYTPNREPVNPEGRTAIVVDDGLATGATMTAALHAVRARRPALLVCAVPVAPVEALARVRPLADEVVCLGTPASLHAVGAFYRDFRQVSDDEVVAALGEAATANHQRETR